jgi:chromate transporter
MNRSSLKEIAFLFLKLGVTAFGGPAAHIALMENEVVNRRKWISHEHFLDLLGATNLIPGPNSTEMAIHIGYHRGGVKGLILAGICFILPAASLTLLFAHFYVAYGTLPEADSFIYGIRCAIIAVILGAVIRLGKPVLRNRFMLVAGLIVTVLSSLHFDEIVLLLGTGILGIVWYNRHRLRMSVLSLFALGLLPTITTVIPTGITSDRADGASIAALGLFFLKIGSILYGSGYVLVAFLQEGLVHSRHWITQTQLLDAVAVGQFTPGPVLSTATFIGYVISGFPGALVSTVGIFLPSFILVLIISPFIPKLRGSPVMKGFLDGVNAASLGLMLAVCVTLGGSTLHNVNAWIIFAIAALALLRWSVNPAWVVGGAAIAGWLLSRFAI